ncbi:MAG: FHA domain-containing protein [Blastocatellia bacterium]
MNDPREKAVTAGEIIESILSSLRQGIEDLSTRRFSPNLFRVHLHSSDFARLEGIFEQLQEEANQALDESLDLTYPSRQASWWESFRQWFRGRSPGRLLGGERSRLPRWQRRTQIQPWIKPEGGWQITFAHQEGLVSRPGEIIIDMILSEPSSSAVPGEVGAPKSFCIIHRTKHPDRANATGKPAATSSRRGGDRRPSTIPERLTQIPWVRERGREQPVLARLEFQERGDRKSYAMTKQSILVGRGRKGVQPDVQLPPLPGISREHFRIRMQEGTFLIQDLSTFGTMIDGYPIPTSLTSVGRDPIETDLWVALPRRCQITLASVLSLEFIAEEER